MLHARHSWEAHGIFAMRLCSPRRCAEWVEQAKRARQWTEAEIAVDEFGTFRANSASRWARVLQGPVAGDVGTAFENAIRQQTIPLVRRIWGVSLSECRGTQLIRYREGGHYVPHSDVGTNELAERYFTALCYLNDNFEGGRTGFPSLAYSAAPSRGKAIIFPSFYWHSAEPVVQGEKFILLTWLCGPSPVRWI